MLLQEIDYPLLQRCLRKERFSWEEFVDRFMEMVLQVIEETVRIENFTLTEEEKSRLCEAVFRAFRYNNFQLLREFEFRCSLSTYLIILSRRLILAFLKY